ncbi:deoxyguanosinetriphosphate triphosphohydrolase [Aquimarina agarilytica]|uniref:deoxyguanosinetriphosphate triphosphohydrolase n=1 Tax=Aquimarina agarilytica TaxID=1087449 RepID=UPI000289C028|nr:deoxyguanosinetriphosphate triphosphohydrolase [Aquimarina agarilytica]
MNWEQLLSLKRQGDTNKRLRKEQDETRLGFEVDYDRIIFSPAFRSLQDKTQVIPLSKTSFVHTRLTHSLEVSVVGRSLGRIVGKKIIEKYPSLKTTHGYQFNDFGAIVAAAALSHDIGNPPFGHSGEKAIGEYFKSGKGAQYQKELTPKQYMDLVKFEGNANGFKILNETKLGIEGGLRLSYATLGAFLKYPKASLPHKPTSHIAHKKYGYFQSEATFFNDLANELGMIAHEVEGEICYHRHPLTFLVEAADDICYTIIDFEDGINLGLVDEDYALEYLIKLVKDSINVKKYHALTTKAERLSYLRALAIGALINEAATIFLENEAAILSGTFTTDLLSKSKYNAQISDIIKISVEKIYQSHEVVEKEIAGYQILNTLLDVYCKATHNYHAQNQTAYDKLILKAEGAHFDYKNEDVYLRLISISQYVASLTDGSALEKFKKVKGLSV